MNKSLNYILTILLLFLLSCAYKPYLKNYQFSVNVNSKSGNEKINSIIISKFESLKESSENYNLDLQSNLVKKIISKDSKGDPAVYELSTNVRYIVKNNDEILIDKNIKRKTTYNNISDKFELENYEDTIITNLSKIISEDILSSISEING